MNDDQLVHELKSLLRETYQLWDPGWVMFNWRNYTYDHVQRVTGLTCTLCEQEGVERAVGQLAGLLHDVTKPYDGPYIVDEEGKRIVDERGLWHNELRHPPRSNLVTQLYDRLELAGKLHNESGAILAEHLLRRHDVPPTTIDKVTRAIRDHLRPPEDAPLESRCLYDADTIDANIGLPAFVRNIYIHLHFYDRRRSEDKPSIDDMLDQDPDAYLVPYVSDNLPNWAAGKRRDFVPRLLTEAGRDVATRRLDRLQGWFAQMQEELPYDGQAMHRCLDVVTHYMRHRDDPSIAQETDYLAREWQNGQTSEDARRLIHDLQREMAGVT